MPERPTPLFSEQVLHGLASRIGFAVAEAAVEQRWKYRWIDARPGQATFQLEPQNARAWQHFNVTFEFHDHNVSSYCSCGVHGRCVHTAAVVLDLLSSDALRRALEHPPVERALLDELPLLRSKALREMSRTAILDAWPATQPAHRVSHAEYTLRIPSRSDIYGRPHHASAAIDVRVNLPGLRAAIGPREIRDYDLTDEAARLLDALVPNPGNKLWVARPPLASILVTALAHETVFDEATGSRIRFAEQAVRPSLVRISRAAFLKMLAAERVANVPKDIKPSKSKRRTGTIPASELPVDVPSLDAIRNLHGLSRVDVPDREIAELPSLLVATWSCPDEGLRFSAAQSFLVRGPRCFVWIPPRATFFPLAPDVPEAFAMAIVERPVQVHHVEDAPTLHRSLARTWQLAGGAAPPAETMNAPPLPTPALTLRIDGTPLDVIARLEARYGEHLFDLPRETAQSNDPERDALLEKRAVERIARAGLHAREDGMGFSARSDDAVAFWRRGIESLRAPSDTPLEIVVAKQLRSVAVRDPLRAKLRVRLVDGLLETKLEFAAGDIAADAERLREAIARPGAKWVVLRDGTLAALQGRVAELAQDAAEVDALGETSQLPVHQLGRLERWISVAEQSEVSPELEAFRTRLRALDVATEPELPTSLTATLRPYQCRGLAWLQFLDALGAGGILADDMGLGKTVMALALLAWRKERDGAAPSLVVCPTSVAGNWIREATRFTPNLRVVLFHGSDRTRDTASLAGSDLVITTYALLRRDIAMLSTIRFRYGILDEAQNVKNAEAATTQSARRLACERRLALTGTPVENHLGELWSLMEFCNPSMLGTRARFGRTYERGVMERSDGPEAQMLRALVRPFVLRRTKREVLTDLPPKEEIDLACTPTPAQRRLYDAVAFAALDQVRKDIQTKGFEQSGISILTALLRLRQMACDPRLVERQHPPSISAKREVFLDLVEELVSEGRRVLVFSQFVELLKLWREDLVAAGIAYEYLDGSTKDRDAVVARFQEGTAPVFLISLRAGGTGLNLTAADTVIHCDPWWNPAVEDQATDRAHRIGQTRAVTVYRLVAKGTVEDKIMVLKGRKREIAESVIREDAGALRGLSVEDVQTLLGSMDTSDDEV